jgi:hypothetical protein
LVNGYEGGWFARERQPAGVQVGEACIAQPLYQCVHLGGQFLDVVALVEGVEGVFKVLQGVDSDGSGGTRALSHRFTP